MLSIFTAAQRANNAAPIQGAVSDVESNEPLPGVSVSVKGTLLGTITDVNGKFKIVPKQLPVTLIFSLTGFRSQEVEVFEEPGEELPIQLTSGSLLSEGVVITASRVEESILKSPVAVEQLDSRAIKETPAPTFYEALENVKGVQMITSSITLKIPNTRGFNTTNNFRFMQLVDGIDIQAATLGVPVGNAIGPTELDIESVEVLPGAASALYGMNAINGMANLLTKSPFTHQGLSVYQKVGVNHVDGVDHDPSGLTESALRYAKAFNEKFAFKINLGYMQGTDWRSNTRLDQNPNNLNSANPKFNSLNGAYNATFDGWNKYGDDALAGSNVVSIGGLTIDGNTNQTLRVARTGYWETDLVSPSVKNLKFDASLHYRISEKAEVSYAYRIGQMDGVFQRGNKVRLDGMTVQNHSLQIKGQDYLVRTYVAIENTGNSYNVKPLADNLDLYSGGASDIRTAASWGTKYKNALATYAASHGGSLTSDNLAEASQFARQQADVGRAEPGTAFFDSLKNAITNINNWDIKSGSIPNAPVTGGAALIQKSRMYNAEAQWDLSRYTKYFDLLIGADARIYEIIPDGNNFVDFSRPIADRNTPESDGSFGNNVYYKKFGGFTQVTKSVLQEKLKFFASLRGDYNPEFNPKFTPRVAAVYTLKEDHNFRITYQQGYRYPALFEALSYVNNGRVKRVGSLSYINEGLGYLENSYTQASVINFNAAVSAQGNTDAAALANRDLLVVANLPKAAPEHINSIEVGYKSLILDNKLAVDFDAYTNTYTGFLGQVQVFVPKGETIGSDAAVLTMLDRNRDATVASGGNAASQGQERYRVYTNARNTYRNFGSSLGLTYNFYKKFTLSGNVSYNEMKEIKTKDIFATGFNTPKWVSNFSFGNREVVKNLGFNIVWRWQDAFEWESPLVTGKISSYNTLDAQASYHLLRSKTTIKFGGSNIFNKRYIQYAGGPTLGALYYISITLDGLL
jgi:iron complex outermembrane recepter protein